MESLRGHALVLCASVALLASGCGADRFEFPDPPVPSAAAAPARSAPCPPEPPQADIPAGFVSLPLPPKSEIVEPAAEPPEGSLRVDLRSDLSVREAYRFYLKTLRALDAGIAFTEYEGIDAEVFGTLGDDVILVRILASCDGRSAISITAEK